MNILFLTIQLPSLDSDQINKVLFELVLVHYSYFVDILRKIFLNHGI